MSHALATRPARSLQDVRQAYSENQYNLLVPDTQMQLPAGVMPVVTTVRVNPDPNGPDVFKQDGGLSLKKSALDRIAAAAGITWVESRRVDDRSHPHYVEWTAVGEMTLPDGTVRRSQGSRTVDMRSDAGSGFEGADLNACRDRDGNMRKKQANQVRQFIQEHAESKAKNRVVRELLGIRQGYTAADLSKPFAVAKLVPDPDSELAQKAVMARMMGATSALFGPAPEPARTEGEVLDADFEETSAPPEQTELPPRASEAGEGGGGGSAAPPLPDVGGPPPMRPPAEDKPLSAEERQKEVNRLWNLARELRVDGDFVELVKTTGKDDYGELELDDFRKLEAAIRGAGGMS